MKRRHRTAALALAAGAMAAAAAAQQVEFAAEHLTQLTAHRADYLAVIEPPGTAHARLLERIAPEYLKTRGVVETLVAAGAARIAVSGRAAALAGAGPLITAAGFPAAHDIFSTANLPPGQAARALIPGHEHGAPTGRFAAVAVGPAGLMPQPDGPPGRTTPLVRQAARMVPAGAEAWLVALPGALDDIAAVDPALSEGLPWARPSPAAALWLETIGSGRLDIALEFDDTARAVRTAANLHTMYAPNAGLRIERQGPRVRLRVSGIERPGEHERTRRVSH